MRSSPQRSDPGRDGGVVGGAAAVSLGRAVLRGIDMVSAAVVIALMAVMVVTIASQVFCRYVLNSSIDWADELTRMTFVWIIFLATPHALARGRHVGIDLLVGRLPSAAARRLYRATCALSGALLAFVAVEAGRVSHDNWNQMLTTLPVGVGLMYLPVSLGCAHCVLHLVRLGWTGAPAVHVEAR